MHELDTTIVEHVNALVDANVAAWGAVIELKAGEAFYLLAGTKAIEYLGRVYRPWPFTISAVRDDGSGELGEVTLTLANVGRIATTHLRSGTWRGRSARLLLFLLTDPPRLVIPAFTFRMTAAEETDTTVALTLGRPDYFGMPLPRRRYIRREGYPSIPRGTVRR